MGTNNSTLTLSKNYFAATGNRKPFHSGIFQCNSSTCVTLANFFFPFIMEQISLELLNDVVTILYMLNMWQKKTVSGANLTSNISV